MAYECIYFLVSHELCLPAFTIVIWLWLLIFFYCFTRCRSWNRDADLSQVGQVRGNPLVLTIFHLPAANISATKAHRITINRSEKKNNTTKQRNLRVRIVRDKFTLDGGDGLSAPHRLKNFLLRAGFSRIFVFFLPLFFTVLCQCKKFRLRHV